MNLSTIVSERAQYWATARAFSEETRKEVQTLLDRKANDELNDRFYRELEFGTGGLRGILGAGTAYMNIYNIRKATWALWLHLRDFFKSEKEIRVAISYDSRRFSKEFAQATAEVLAAAGAKVFLTREMRPVPMLSYLVRQRQCHGGVCITASHNPPNYNGFKVYWQHGGQLVPPHDMAIIKQYESIKNLDEIPQGNYQANIDAGAIVLVGEDLDQAYFRDIASWRLLPGKIENFRIVYTPLHGTGGYPVARALKIFGFENVMLVPEQAEPDGRFPTVAAPNPEEPSALEMAIDLAKRSGADLVLGTDPDADRIGIVVREGESWRLFNGNQIGCLMTEYVLSSLNRLKRMPESPLFIKTIVTTDLQAKIAHYYGVHVDETLTGFKWICDLVERYEIGAIKPYRQYVCGGEESYGFLAGRFVRDKDAVMSCCLAAEMVAYYRSVGKSMSSVLDELFERHGIFHEELKTLTFGGMSGAEKMAKMMEKLRYEPPKVINLIPVSNLKDYQRQIEIDLSQGRASQENMVDLPKSDVLQFILKDGSKVSVRPSGTEPKIKFYVSVSTTPDECREKGLGPSKEQCQRRALGLIDALTEMVLG